MFGGNDALPQTLKSNCDCVAKCPVVWARSKSSRRKLNDGWPAILDAFVMPGFIASISWIISIASDSPWEPVSRWPRMTADLSSSRVPPLQTSAFLWTKGKLLRKPAQFRFHASPFGSVTTHVDSAFSPAPGISWGPKCIQNHPQTEEPSTNPPCRLQLLPLQPTAP